MHAGRLDRLIEIQRATETQNSYGEPVKAWTSVATVWAERKDESGAELFAASQDQARMVTTFRIRYRDEPRITPAMRVIEGEESFDVEAVLEVGRREALALKCVAVV